MSPDREIYPNAPLQLVAAEARFPLSPRLASLEPAVAIEALGDLLPVVEEGQALIQLTLGPAGQDPPEPRSLPSDRLLRLFSKSRTLAVTITGHNVIVETTDYDRFENFEAVLERVLNALDSFGPPVAIERLGLRYIDEIRAPEITEVPGDWHAFIDERLISAIDLAAGALAGQDMKPQTWQGLLQLGGTDHRAIQVRYGAGQGTVVNPNGLLRFPREVETGPAFLIDIDSFWAPDGLADFSVQSLLEMLRQLHSPVRDVFEGVITERLRDEVLRSKGV